jgi:hypothetical protein
LELPASARLPAPLLWNPEISRPVSTFPAPILVDGVLISGGPIRLNYGSLLLPVGPVRIDYGQPIHAEDTQFRSRHLDAPGPGYREQKSKALSK